MNSNFVLFSFPKQTVRGISSAYIRSKGEQREERFIETMADVDEKIKNVPFSKLQSDREELSSKNSLMKYLQRHREKVKCVSVFCDVHSRSKIRSRNFREGAKKCEYNRL